MADYDLILGALSLHDNDYLPDVDSRLDVLGEDVTLGNPVPASEVVASMMRDGDLTRTNRFGNREASFRVQVTSTDAIGLAEAEALVMAELDKPNTLTWRVPYAADTVFEVVRSWPEFLFDDQNELRVVRTFRVVLECLPFPRSVDTETIVWTGPGSELDSVTSLTGWTVVSGSAVIDDGSIHTASSVRLAKTVTPDDFLWVKVETTGATTLADSLTDVTVAGVTVDPATWRVEEPTVSPTVKVFTIPTGTWRGQAVEVAFTMEDPTLGGSWLREFWTTSYPAPTPPADVETATKPRGVGVIDVVGSARCPATISFTAPAGGAFVYTAPDPVAAVRERGAGEVVFASFEVVDPAGDEFGVGSQLMWFPPGVHAANIGVTAPQPESLNPDGMWPTQASGAFLTPDRSQWTYPVDSQAATAFFADAGAVTIVSPSASLPEGYHTEASHYEVPSLHPGRCGFAVLDVNGDPVTATITYHPHWWHHAGQ